jgi:hypothetical protein
MFTSSPRPPTIPERQPHGVSKKIGPEESADEAEGQEAFVGLEIP